MHECSVAESNSLAAPWTVDHQAPLSTGFPKQEYWSGLPFPSPGDLPNPGIEPVSPVSPTLASRFFAIVPPGEPFYLGGGALLPLVSRCSEKRP